MKRLSVIGATAVALSAVGCSQDRPTEQIGSLPPATAALTSSPNGCQQNTHPGGTIVDKIVTPPAWAMAVRDDGLAYFTEAYNAGVGITSTRTKTLDGFIPTGNIPTGVAFSPDGAMAYVANQGDNNVSIINVSTAQVVATVPTSGLPAIAVQASLDGSRLFIGTASPTVLIMDTGTNQIIASVDVGLAPNAFVVAPDNRIIYVSAFLNGSVTELDMFTGTALRTFIVGGTPQGMAITRKGDRLYVANEAGYLTEITLQTGAITATMTLAGGGFGVGVTADDNQAWVTIPSQGKVQIFGLQNHHLSQGLTVGGNPRRLGFSQHGAIGAIANLDGFVTFVR
ncbi:MAG TPA: YncE family protein [Gemmatimonadales bacterium]|nr:YncE family protein [Gemmatimonadales bacterium]